MKKKIDFKDIVLTEEAHKKPMLPQMNYVHMIRNKKFDTDKMVFPVRALNNGKYSLLSNRRFYEIFKRAKVHQVVVEVFEVKNRIDFLIKDGRTFKMNIDKITIPSKYTQNKPSEVKLQMEINHYNEHGCFSDIIIIKKQKDKLLLHKGYTRIYAANLIGVKMLDAIQI